MAISASSARKINALCLPHGYSVVRQNTLPNSDIECENLLSITDQKNRKNYLGIRITKSLNPSRRWNEKQIQDIRALLYATRVRKVEALVILCPSLKEGTSIQILSATDVLKEALDTYAQTEETQTSYWAEERADILSELDSMPQSEFEPVSDVSLSQGKSIAYRSIVKIEAGEFHAFASPTQKDVVVVMPLGHSQHRHNLHDCVCEPFAEVKAEEWNKHAPVLLPNGHESHRMLSFDAQGNLL